jgi:hypothetical protein
LEARSPRTGKHWTCGAIDGTGADPDDQRAVVFAAHVRVGGIGPDLDGDSHEPSVAGRIVLASHVQSSHHAE